MAVGYIVLCLVYVYAFQRDPGRSPSAATGSGTLLPFQVLFRDLPSADQRIFRSMQEGSLEAVRLRAESGHWPSTTQLAAAGVPPVATDVLDKDGHRWADRREGLVLNYLGVPADAARTAFLILVQEPDPVTGERPPPPSVVDEEHQLLPGGVLLHVTYWKRSSASFDAGTIVDPALQGWQQIRVKTLFEEIGAG
jgi:hypothetical protein